MAITLIPAGPQHVVALGELIQTHGPNVWNWLPEDGVQEHLRDIELGHAHAVLALEDGVLLGAVTFCRTQGFQRYQPPERSGAEHGYVCEAVVRRDQAGRGLGAQLLRAAVQTMQTWGLQEVYIDRHEENAASAGMMRKAGFVEIDTFAEPNRRPHGSGRTTVCRLALV
ncbi:MAG: hypothetical protein A3F78_16825 [Burkholderiales bacterium RIFCSPLOWO2_12_FULL_61_40]|nr:MAG: hypothetical protein A3F78_16825 [Burkholderiales bacterium RIFCSPLOWO2_12_FULL_61_40]